jgi:hypothetical protein
MWLALFCLIGLGPVIAIKVAAPPASLVVGPARDQGKTEPAFALDEAAKSDRLELPGAAAEAEIIVPSAKTPPAKTMPAAIASISPETINKVADRHWEDANASISRPVASPHRHTKAREVKKSAAKIPSTQRAEAWHCRQDAVGGLLRSLDLSPRCNS